MPISKDHLVDVLRVRYDAYSAEAVFTQACVRAGLDGTTSFDQRSLASFREGLNQVGDRVGGVLARIDALLEDPSTAAPEAKIEAKIDAKSDAKTKGETKGDAKGDAKTDAKSEAKAAKADAKAETKTETKSEAKSDAKPEATTDATAATTTIVLRGLDAGDSEMVLVCGAHPAIGDWEPDQAALMSRTGDEWSVTLDLPVGAEVAFKFLVQDEDGEVTWEAGGNRTVRANQTLEATWRDAS